MIASLNVLLHSKPTSSIVVQVLAFTLLIFIFVHWYSNVFNVNQIFHVDQINENELTDEEDLISSKRGFVAVLYSGTARSFSTVFQSHIINLFASSPYTVHLFFYLYANEWRAGGEKHEDYFHSLYSVNSTLDYFDSYVNLDGQRVRIWSMVKGYVFEPVHNPELVYTDQLNVLDKKNMFLSPIGSVRYQSSILLSMFHSTKGSNSLKRTYEKLHSMKYIWVFRVRCDMLLRTNVWEDIFNVETYNSQNQKHRDALKFHLDLQKELLKKNHRKSKSTKNRQILTSYENYDANELEAIKNKVYLPTFYFEEFVFVAQLNPLNTLYTPACDENAHVNDQFGFSSSLIMDHYEARSSVNDIKYMIKDENKFNFVWGGETTLEFKLKQISVPFKTVKVCWNIIRVQATTARSERNAFYSSSNHEYCYYADYHGRTCCDQSCTYWISKWNKFHSSVNQLFDKSSPFFEPTLNNSQIFKDELLKLRRKHHNLENRRGFQYSNELYDLESFYTKLKQVYENELRKQTSKRAQVDLKKENISFSNHYFLHVYGRMFNRIPCLNNDYSTGPLEKVVKSLNMINPYHDKYFPFIQTTPSQLKQCLFRKHQTCQQINDVY